MAGHSLLELMLVVAIFLGLAPLLQQPGVFTVIALAGSAILIWMAFGMFRALPALRLVPGEGEVSRSQSLVMAGVLMSLANPYWSVWWVTIGLGYILQSIQFGLLGVGFFFIGHILADFLWYSAISAAVAKGGRLLTDRLYRVLTGFCAGFLVLFAVYFFYAGLQSFI